MWWLEQSAKKRNMEPDNSKRPPLPRRKYYSRRFSAEPPSPSVEPNTEEEGMVVTEAKISIQFEQPLRTPSSAQSATPKQAYALSKSFSYEAGGVKRRVPVTPAVNTSHRQHETSYYKHGTLVFRATARPQTDVPTDSAKIVLSVPIAPSQKQSLAPKFSCEPMASSLVLDFCKTADLDALKVYLKNAAPGSIGPGTINMRDASNQTGLWYACATGNVAIARELLRLQGIDVNAADKEGNTPLHVAAQAGHADIVSLLTLAPDADLESRNSAGLTPLMKAALQGRLRCVRVLLLAGASTSARDHGRGLCALEWAKFCNRQKCADLIETFSLRPVPLRSSDASRWTSEPNLKRSISATSLSSNSRSNKDSWVKATIKKAFQSISGRSPSTSDSASVTSVASQLTNAAWCSAMPLLPRAERCDPQKPLPTPPTAPTLHFSIPQIQISFWSQIPSKSLAETPIVVALPPPPQSPVRKPTTPAAVAVVKNPPGEVKAPSRLRARRLRNMTSPEGFVLPRATPTNVVR